jgi:hypothetical protein
LTNYFAFDIETVKRFPDGDSWRNHRPLGIACAAAAAVCFEQPRVWHGAAADGSIATRMDQEELRQLVGDLVAAVDQGFTLLTWNGMGFDFDILAEESGLIEECRALARNHVDMMFHLFCVKGFPLALRTACIGSGTTSKVEGMDGAKAVQMWHAGARQEVIDYCVRDVQATLELANATERKRRLTWLSKAGNPQFLPIPSGWKKVDNALRIPEPDTSWMSRPLARSEFTAWLRG